MAQSPEDRPRFSSPPSVIFWSLFVAAILGLAVATVFVRLHVLETPARIAPLDTGTSRSITITAKRSWEAARPYFYQVEIGGQIVVPPRYIGASTGDHGWPEFKVRRVPGTDLWVVWEAASPEIAFAIHDFATNETWPGFSPANSANNDPDSGPRLLRRLNANGQLGVFILSDDAHYSGHARLD